jgi:hypothetical protein
MKRPDTFVVVDSKNGKNLCDSLGVAYTTLGLHNYWERIVEPISKSRWWQSPRPQSKMDRDIWDSRAAFLDSLFYQH